MKQPSLLGRGLAAVALLVGFYLLALGVALGMLWLIYLQLAAGTFSIKLILLLALGAGTILWSIRPRWDDFEPPGPRLVESEHPELFEAIHDVAERTGQAPPQEVYLVNDMNAFVAQRGGFMGLFSRRVMGLGLPLLQVCSVSQLRAILAHEFGHYHGGDTKLGPWIYKTRSAIGRTIMSLRGQGSAILHKPFEWYGNIFLEVTQKISRAQEYAADALAAKTIGPKHLAEGLKKVHGGAVAFQSFWRGEFVPVLAAGYRPPLAAGFAKFLNNDRLTEALKDAVAEEIAADDEDPFDTHPPLGRRLEALADADSDDEESDSRRAVELLAADDDLEYRLLSSIVVADHMADVQDIGWAETVDLVYADSWKEGARQLRPHVRGMTFSKIPASRKALAGFADANSPEDFSEVPMDVAAHFAANQLGCAMADALLRAGWKATADVGEPVVFSDEKNEIKPFELLHQIADKELKRAEFRELLENCGISDLPLVSEKRKKAAEPVN